MVTDFHLRDPAASDHDPAHARTILKGLARLAAQYPDAAACVIAGDIADREERSVYAWLRPHLDALPFPVITMTGNHDDRAAMCEVFGIDGPFVQNSLFGDGACCLFLDTCDPGRKSGTLCEERLDWIRDRLEQADGRPVVLFMHHPPCKIGDPVLDPIRLDNPDRLAEIIAAHDVQQIFFGHVHRTLTTSWNGIPAFSLARPTLSLPALRIEIAGDAIVSVLDGSHR